MSLKFEAHVRKNVGCFCENMFPQPFFFCSMTATSTWFYW